MVSTKAKILTLTLLASLIVSVFFGGEVGKNIYYYIQKKTVPLGLPCITTQHLFKHIFHFFLTGNLYSNEQLTFNPKEKTCCAVNNRGTFLWGRSSSPHGFYSE